MSRRVRIYLDNAAGDSLHFSDEMAKKTLTLEMRKRCNRGFYDRGKAELLIGKYSPYSSLQWSTVLIGSNMV